MEAVSFTMQGGAFALLLIGGGVWWAVWLPKHPEIWRTLPRERYAGLVLGFLCLWWSAHLVTPMLEGPLEGLRRLLPVVVLALTGASWFCLDYLFTRALAGFLLLTSNHLLHEAFVAHAAWRPAFSVVCYVTGIVALVLLASPWRFRDCLESSAQQPRRARAFAAGLGACGVVSLLVAVLSHGR